MWAASGHSSDAASVLSLARQHDADTVKAAVAYSEGLIFLDHKDTTRAREAFEKALVADPKLAAARTELAALDL